RHPKDGLGYMDAASAYMAMKEFEKAIECAARAMKLSASNTRAPDLLSKAFRAAGKLNEARALDEKLRAAYEKTYEHDPSPNNANNLAWFYAERGLELPKAIEIAQKAVAAKPEAAYIDTLGWARFQAGDVEGAIKDLERAAALDADEVLSYHLAAALAKAGKRSEALDALERCLSRSNYFEEREAALSLRDALVGKPAAQK
ncbi:MAG: tetratricopeptide repeat protein, partial [Planctomycetes bacterium]|nr:tetratricopeptide repeat protein [Planctomycetota bacterium]